MARVLVVVLGVHVVLPVAIAKQPAVIPDITLIMDLVCPVLRAAHVRAERLRRCQ